MSVDIKIVKLEDKVIQIIADYNDVFEVSIEGWIISQKDYTYNSNSGLLLINTNNPGCWKWVKLKWWEFWKEKVITNFQAVIRL